ncbi:hypothetical protein KAX29_02625 [candidate division WOR-3 bacterium]|nr:hypothetical protein [candidate division WOR-3 bacterium]
MKVKTIHGLLFLCLFGIFSCSRTAVISLKEAEEIVLKEILENNTEGKAVYELPTLMESGTVVKPRYDGDKEYIAKKDCWFFFIDDDPEAYWSHHCRYVFVYYRGNGEYEVINEKWWPKDIIDGLVPVEFQKK